MKNNKVSIILIILVTVALLFCGKLFSQGIYVPVNPTVYGTHQLRTKSDSVLHMPDKNGLTTNTYDTSSQIFYNKSDSSIWAWSLAKGFFKVGSGGSGGSTDTTSLSNRINSKLNILDTSLMLDVYLRKQDSTIYSSKYQSEIRYKDIDICPDSSCIIFISDLYRDTVFVTSGLGGSSGIDSTTTIKTTIVSDTANVVWNWKGGVGTPTKDTIWTHSGGGAASPSPDQTVSIATNGQTVVAFTGVPSSYNDFWMDINGGTLLVSNYSKSGNNITLSMTDTDSGDKVTLHFK